MHQPVEKVGVELIVTINPASPKGFQHADTFHVFG